MRVLVLNGPNLNLLGRREPALYGSTSLADLETQISKWAVELGVIATFHQSNHEGGLVDAIQGAAELDGIVINPGALTHTSRSIPDAIRAVGAPTVEIHISNVRRRETWRADSFVSEVVVRTIYGRGLTGYRDALRHLVNRAAFPVGTVRYGPHLENVADLRVPPDGGGSRLIILIHGGFWLGEWERDTMETLAVDLTSRGFATLNLEYRRLGAGGGWPGPGHDVLTAAGHVSQMPEVSAARTAIIGHSAGGHIALWAARRGRGRPVDLTVGLAPVTDLGAMAGSDGVGSRPAAELLQAGAPPDVDVVPGKSLLVHGADDEVVPVSHSTRLGDGADVVLVEDLGHFEMLDPLRAHWPRVMESLSAALQ
jgi:3-dehydroquinate dehydratase-2